MPENDVLIGIVLEDSCLTLEELAAACAVSRDWVVSHVTEGLLPAQGDTPETWRFSSLALRRARRLRELESDFDAVPELAALVADLVEEIALLRAQLRRAGMPSEIWSDADRSR